MVDGHNGKMLIENRRRIAKNFVIFAVQYSVLLGRTITGAQKARPFFDGFCINGSAAAYRPRWIILQGDVVVPTRDFPCADQRQVPVGSCKCRPVFLLRIKKILAECRKRQIFFSGIGCKNMAFQVISFESFRRRGCVATGKCYNSCRALISIVRSLSL